MKHTLNNLRKKNKSKLPFFKFTPVGRRLIALPSSRLHVIRGVGWPLALQKSDASSPSFVVTSLDESSSDISGGTVNK